MSKKAFKNMPKRIRVTAMPGRVIKDKNGNVVKQLYNIYQMF